MNTRIRRRAGGLLAGAVLLSGCATPEGRLALETFGRGVMNLVLSPLMIVSGIAQGISFLPYTIGTGLAALNRGFLEAQAVSIDDSYRSTFGVSIADPRVNQQSGEIAGQEGLYGRYRPEAIFEANRAFQRLLVSQGMPEDRAQHYALTGNYSYAWSRGHILLAVVYRHSGKQPFRVASKHTGIVTTFRPDHRGWYEPYARDANGQVIDEVIDWTGMEYTLLRQDKVVATLMALAVEAVKSGKRSTDYWPAEQRWMVGETAQVIRESVARVKIDQPAASAPAAPPAPSPR